MRKRWREEAVRGRERKEEDRELEKEKRIIRDNSSSFIDFVTKDTVLALETLSGSLLEIYIISLAFGCLSELQIKSYC